jgi:lysophospholipase L1-like esterase
MSGDASPPATSAPSRWWFPIAVAGAGLVLALGVAEVTVRLAMALSPQLAELFADPTAVQIAPHGEHGYRQRPGARLTYANGSVATANALGWRGPEVPLTKREHELRVVLLGGSTTHGWGVNDEETLDAAMRESLQRRFPDRTISVVNLGYDGYDSWQDWERWRSDGARLGPDVVVIHSGINDVRNARWALTSLPDPRTLIWEPVLVRLRAEQQHGGPSWRTRVKRALALARVPGAIRDRLRERARVADPAPTPHREAIAQFDTNVRRIVDDARQRGVSVVLSTPPSALRSLPPTSTSTISYWIGTAATTQQIRDSLDARLRVLGRDGGPTVRYVAAQLPPSAFLDDCHLTPAGNRELGDALTEAIATLVPPLRGGTPR